MVEESISTREMDLYDILWGRRVVVVVVVAN